MAENNNDALEYFVKSFEEGKYEYDNGEIWRLWEPRRYWLDVPKRAEKITSNGYYILRTSVKSLKKPLYVMAHRVIWTYFKGEIPEGMVINHKNGIKTDNRLENLEIVTQKQNVRHALETGLTAIPLGLDRPNARLSDDDVRTIRMLAKSGLLKRDEIAKFYNIASPYVSQIKSGMGRSHVKDIINGTFGEYQEKSKRTLQPLTVEEGLKNYSMGIVGELGEVIDILKKHLYHGHDLDKEKVKEEIGDVLFYISAIATTLDIRLSDIALENVVKLIKRYPNGFSQEDSIKRVDTL